MYKKILLLVVSVSAILLLSNIAGADSGNIWRSCCASGCDYAWGAIVYSGSTSFTCCQSSGGWTSGYCAPTTTTTTTTIPTGYTLTVEARIDKLDTVMQNVRVTVDGVTKYSTATYSLAAGSHSISAEDPTGSRPFSHFYDHDANADCNQNDPYDTA
jgi:hypothetical protein